MAIPPPPETGSRPASPRVWLLGLVSILVVLLLGAGHVIGGELAAVAGASLRVLPFVPLAVLSYLGTWWRWARWLALLWLGGLVLGFSALAVGAGVGALTQGPSADSTHTLTSEELGRLAYMMLGMAGAIVIGSAGFLRGVRQALSRALPLNPDSFVHTIALVAVVTLSLISFVPLAVLGEPPLIAFLSGLIGTQGEAMAEQEGGAVLRGELYGLAWLVPSALVAVGVGIRRDLRQALRRLGLVRPTMRQVAGALGLGVLLVLLVSLLGLAIEWFWGLMGWETSGGASFDEAFGRLLAPFMSLQGAVVLAITAGLGEELAVRGVLQPRLGILLSNLFFTGLHAFQYNWDAVLVVLLLGIVLGMIRRRTNTTSSVMVHATYDFLLVIAMMAQVPVVGE